MYVLGIETATMTGSVAVMTEYRLLAEYTLTSQMTHTERLLSAIDHLLTAAALRVHDLDGIAVSVGPGSFTGLRIGVTTAKSLAYSLRKPVAAIPSLDALATQFVLTDMLICPMLDARKKEVYAALYRPAGTHMKRVSEYAVIAPERFLREIQEPTVFLGDGVLAYRSMIESIVGENAVFADPAHLFPRGSLIAQCGCERIAQGDTDDCLALTPLYVRQSEAELHWERHQQIPHHA